MSRFEELCQLYNSSYDEMYDDLENCVQFVEILMTGMVYLLECPEKRIQYKDKLGEDKSLRGCLKSFEEVILITQAALTLNESLQHK